MTALTQLILVGMTNVFSPTFARFLGARQREESLPGYSRALRLMILLAMPISIGGLVLGPPLINLAYGARYEDAGPVLRILVAVVPLTAVGAISTALLVGYGKMRIPIVVAAISALTDIVAAALLVPRMDAIGAAIANDLAVLAATVILLIYCVRLLGLVEIAPRHLPRMGRPFRGCGCSLQGRAGAGIQLPLAPPCVRRRHRVAERTRRQVRSASPGGCALAGHRARRHPRALARSGVPPARGRTSRRTAGQRG